MADSISQLGLALGTLGANQQNLQNNSFPDNSTGQINVVIAGRVNVTGKMVAIAKYYATTSFILDHPVYGTLDSAVYALDSGYNAALQSTVLNITL